MLANRQSKGDKVFDTINITLLSLALLIVAYPLIYVLSASLSDPLAVMSGQVFLFPKGFNLNAYVRVFQNSEILTGYRNTIMYTLVGTFINVILTILGAYPLSRKDFYGRNIFMALFTFTMFFSGGMIPTYMVIKSLGLIDNFWVMILPGAVTMYNLIIMRTFFQNTIPEEISEAAFLDGCSNTRLLVRIVIPLSAPVIAVMVLFYGVAHWNAFFNALMYLSDKDKYPLQLILRQILIQNQIQNMTDGANESMVEQQLMIEGLKYAVIIVASLPVLILYPMLQKYFVGGVMIGALKG